MGKQIYKPRDKDESLQAKKKKRTVNCINIPK